LLTWTPTKEGIYTITVTVTNHFNLKSTYSFEVLVKAKQDGVTAPVAWFPLDGDVKDHSGHGFDAQSNGVQLAADARGKSNSAYRFSSENDIIFVPNQLSLNFLDAVTLSFWVNTSQVPEESFILSHGSWEERWKVSFIPDGRLRWTAKTTAATGDLDSSDPIPVNEYHHVTVAYTGYSMELYLDGELDTFTKHSGSLQQTSKSITFGRKDEVETRYSLKGILDEVRIYNQVLSPEEIATLRTLWSSDVVTGLEEESALTPYPNPARGGVINIDAASAEVSVTDVLGRELAFTKNERDGKTEIRLGNNVQGIVLLKIATQKGSFVFKILAQ